MALECPHCHASNPDGTLWCIKCNKKIQPELVVYSQDVKISPSLESQMEEKPTFKRSSKSPSKRIFRTILYLIILTLLFVITIIVAVVLSSY